MESRRLLKWIWLLAFSCVAMQNAAADSPVNGGFEDGISGWTLFVPDESKDKNCRFDVVTTTPHSGNECVRLQSDDFARFGIGSEFMLVHEGDRYRVSVWVRADAAATARPKSPGFVIRLFLRQGTGDAAGGHMFIGLGSEVSRNTPFVPESVTLPTSWTKIEAVVEIPTGVDSIGPALFSWWMQGTILADDFSIEKVDDTTTLSPVLPDATKPIVPATK